MAYTGTLRGQLAWNDDRPAPQIYSIYFPGGRTADYIGFDNLDNIFCSDQGFTFWLSCNAHARVDNPEQSAIARSADDSSGDTQWQLAYFDQSFVGQTYDWYALSLGFFDSSTGRALSITHDPSTGANGNLPRFQKDTWATLAATYKRTYSPFGVAAEITLFINGVEVGRQSAGHFQIRSNSEARFYLGRGLEEETGAFIGAMDRMRMWSRALSASEVAALG